MFFLLLCNLFAPLFTQNASSTTSARVVCLQNGFADAIDCIANRQQQENRNENVLNGLGFHEAFLRTIPLPNLRMEGESKGLIFNNSRQSAKAD